MSIEIFGISYTIRIAEDSPLNQELLIGQVNDKTAVITVCGGLPIDVEFSTILHEVIHTISNKMQLELEEKIVVALESGIMSVLINKDNQSVFNYYLKGCRQK